MTDVDASETVVTVVTNLHENPFLMMQGQKGITSLPRPPIHPRSPTKNPRCVSFERLRGQLQPGCSPRTRGRPGNHDSHWTMVRRPERLAALAEVHPNRRTQQQGPRERAVNQESSLAPFCCSGTKQVANLVSHESSHICQARHVTKCKQGPLPTCSLTPDHDKG